MSEIAPISASAATAAAVSPVRPDANAHSQESFAQMLLNGVERVDRRLAAADALVARFAVDDSIPLHQVTIALEHARLSIELMTLIRSRLVESYQEMMRMQI